MGWKDVAKLASGWAGAKKDELLTADQDEREQARARAQEIQQQARQEVGTSFLEKVLPPEMAEKVTAHRPENVAAREAEEAVAAETARRERLAGMSTSGDTAELTLTISGGESGTVTVTLPCEREEEHPDPADLADVPEGEAPPLSWLRLRLEAVDPVPVGSTSLVALGIGVPDYRGPGRYDLAELHRRGEAGEIGWWEAMDLYLQPVDEADDRTWWVDVNGAAPVVVEVADGSLTFDLPMASAVSAIRATGTIRWG
ncbi:hypothetical protein [Nocardioides sp. SYSU D00038]|uniref:hypothetical protein n=1 Tax=Nocardioides sp. SYSU D00038 TaxID=2812554 RepID=UPI0019681E7D|nr:hypothetical protein [Nocardioides sp. SYSU D00038]